MRKQLPPVPSLESLKNQAKQLLKAHQAGDPDACSRIGSSFPRLAESGEAEIHAAAFSLRDAQLVVAREYGYASWPKMAAVIELGDDEPQPELECATTRPEGSGSFTQIANPYITGSPVRDPRQFFGRDDDFAAMRQHLHSAEGVFLLTGPRRAGKTSMLQQIVGAAWGTSSCRSSSTCSSWPPQRATGRSLPDWPHAS